LFSEVLLVFGSSGSLLTNEESSLCEVLLPLLAARPGIPDDTEETPDGGVLLPEGRPIEKSLFFNAAGEEVAETIVVLPHTT
jgi:hypothetical protein